MINFVASIVVLCWISMVVSALDTVLNPYGAGTYSKSVGFATFGTHTQPPPGANVHYTIVAPTEATSALPVLYFWTSFAGKVPAVMFLELFEKISAHGIIVVGMDLKFEPQSKLNFQLEEAVMLEGAMSWFQDGNLESSMASKGLNSKPDFTKIVLSGHSAGGHTVAQILTDGCFNITAAILIDPVDGYAPWAISDVVTKITSVIHPPAKVRFTIPLLHIDNLLDPVSPFPDHAMYPACAPTDMSNDRFFLAWRGPAWQINATFFGHMDVINMGAIDELNHVFDVFCAGNRTVSNAEYLDLVSGSVVAFTFMVNNVAELNNGHQQATLTASEQYQQYLENASLMPTAVTLKQDYHGFVPPFAGFCNHMF